MRRMFLLVFVVLTAAPLMAAQASADTQVQLRPSFLDAARFGPVTGAIHIETDSPGTYAIKIAGVPADWLDYPSSVRVEKGVEKSVGYVVMPGAAGKYVLAISVSGPAGTFDSEERLWVGYPSPAEPAAQGSAPAGSSGTGGTTGMFSLGSQDGTMAVSFAIALAAAVAIVLGYATLKREKAGENAQDGTHIKNFAAS